MSILQVLEFKDILLLIAVLWFGAIIYYIPIRLYLDQRDPNLDSK
jgi:hypothetical protein